MWVGHIRLKIKSESIKQQHFYHMPLILWRCDSNTYFAIIFAKYREFYTNINKWNCTLFIIFVFYDCLRTKMVNTQFNEILSIYGSNPLAIQLNRLSVFGSLTKSLIFAGIQTGWGVAESRRKLWKGSAELYVFLEQSPRIMGSKFWWFVAIYIFQRTL